MTNEKEFTEWDEMTNEKEFTEWDELFERYYLHPDPQKMYDALIENKKFIESIGLNGCIVGFFSQYFILYPDMAKKMFDYGINKIEGKNDILTLAFALACKENHKLIHLINKNNKPITKIFLHLISFILRFSSNKANPVKLKVKTPFQLDALWGAFFATGNTLFIEKMLEFIDRYSRKAKLLGSNAVRLSMNKNISIALEAAMWSLGSNAKSHQIIKAYLEQQGKKMRWHEITIQIIEDILIQCDKPYVKGGEDVCEK